MDNSVQDQKWMNLALDEAVKAGLLGEVPVGAVVVCGGEVVAQSSNRRETLQDPVAHAEVLALKQAAEALGSWRLNDCSIYVTLEPCAMCAGAIVNSRIARLVFGARDSKAGFCGSLGDLVSDERLNHRVEVRQGVCSEESSALLRAFFRKLRR